jgi:OOP family OmpA-OmpF porin
MKTTSKLTAIIALACASMMATNPAIADPVTTDSTFINPDWANSAWYMGAGVGQSRARIDDARLVRSLTANGATMNKFNADERDLGFKLFVGKQLNQYLSLEAGFRPRQVQFRRDDIGQWCPAGRDGFPRRES